MSQRREHTPRRTGHTCIFTGDLLPGPGKFPYVLRLEHLKTLSLVAESFDSDSLHYLRTREDVKGFPISFLGNPSRLHKEAEILLCEGYHTIAKIPRYALSTHLLRPGTSLSMIPKTSTMRICRVSSQKITRCPQEITRTVYAPSTHSSHELYLEGSFLISLFGRRMPGTFLPAEPTHGRVPIVPYLDLPILLPLVMGHRSWI